jgi:lipoprotein-anchoring transpeptidase ErfK/SrfK
MRIIAIFFSERCRGVLYMRPAGGSNRIPADFRPVCCGRGRLADVALNCPWLCASLWSARIIRAKPGPKAKERERMKAPTPKTQSRRAFLAGAAGLGAVSLAAPALAQMGQTSTEFERDLGSSQRRNVSSFRSLQWQDYFEDTRKGAILVDITSRALHFWSADQSVYRLYPTSVPLTEDLTRRGRTQVVDKVVNPPWRPTPAMRERNPEWPEFVPGGDPSNPLGVRALYLSWQFYRIHGTHDTRKIGRRSSNGCVGLYNEHILELFDMAEIGTQVLLI